MNYLNGKSLSLADLVVSAQAAALKAFQANDKLAAQTVKLEEFGISGLGREDFDTWEYAFNAHLDTLTNFRLQDAPSVTAAKKAAAIAAAAAAANTPVAA